MVLDKVGFPAENATDRISLRPSTVERLQRMKKRHESWDELVRRLMDNQVNGKKVSG
jgi:predicted CopG family antitoxin